MKQYMMMILLFMVACGRNPTIRYEGKKSIEQQSLAGIAAFRREEYESAKVFFEEALSQAYQLYLPTEIVKQCAHLGEVYLRMNKPDEGRTYLQIGEKIALQEGIRSFDLALVWARYYQKRGEQEKAKASYELMISYAKTKTEKILGWIHYADFYIEQENWEQARQTLEKVGPSLWFFSDNDILGLYYYYLGLVAKGEKQYEKALQAFQRALFYDRLAENTHGIRKDIIQLMEVNKLKNDEAKALYYQELLRFSLDKNKAFR